MGDLHSMANYNYFSQQQHTSYSSTSSSLAWDLLHPHDPGVFNGDSSSSFMDSVQPSFSTDLLDHSDLSTGYLEDALVEFHDRSKKRRLFMYSEDDHDQIKSYWNSNFTCLDLYENLDNCMSQTNSFDKVSDEPISTSGSIISEEEANIFSSEEIKKPKEDAISSSPSDEQDQPIIPSQEKEKNEMTRRIRGRRRRMVYPFGVVKPGGEEGEVTLNDINQRIQMAPTRPVRHPVGDFACRPCVTAANGGPGLSGKAVVALTKIHTQGRGTITIIRTKG